MNNTTLIELTEGQRKIYNLFYDAMRTGQYSVVLPKAVKPDSIIYYIKLAIAENPEFSDYDTCNCNYYVQSQKCIVEMKHAFHNRNMGIELRRKANEILKPILGEKISEIKSVLFVHDYLVKHTVYEKSTADNLLYHTAYGAIVNGEAVCEGISYAFSYLLKLVGIKSTVVNGEADGSAHAWNIVKVGGECFHFDVTWDLLRQNNNRNMNFDYFCLSDENLKNRIWDRKLYPKCRSNLYNYFNLSKSLAHTETELTKIIERQYAEYNEIYLRCDCVPSGQNGAEYIWDKFSEIAQRNRWAYGEVRYSFNEDQSVFSLYSVL